MLNMFINPVLMAVSEGTGFLKPLYWLFGRCMEFLLTALNNEYFIAIIIFTILTRLVLLPVNIHQQKTTAQTARIQPKIQKIQKKYNISAISDPRERQKAQSRLNEEMQDLYAREGHNPMQMGCGPMIFQMVFLMGIIGIIYYPLSYVINIPNFGEYSEQLTEFVKSFLGIEGKTTFYLQLSILENWNAMKDSLVAQFPDLFTADKISAIESYRSGLYIGSLDMTAIPHWKDGLIVIIPLLSLATSLGSSIISMIIQKKNNPAAAQQMGSMMMMMLMMPLFSFYIAFKVPAAVGFYWIVSNVVAILQQLFIAKFYPPRKSQAKLMLDNTIYRRSREESIKKMNK